MSLLIIARAIKLTVLLRLPFKKKRVFTERLKHRHQTFWDDPRAESFRNTPLKSFASVELLYREPHWQRLLSNKANAMHFAELNGCSVPEVYWQGRDVSEIPFDKLPPQFVLKPTIGHSCQNVFLMVNGVNLMDKKPYSNNQLIHIMQEVLLQVPHNEFLVEEFLMSEDGEYRIPTDYKLHTFNGEIARIEAIHRFSANKGIVRVFDADWNRQENIGEKYKDKEKITDAPPACLPEIINQAKKLSRLYQIYVRIDFYATNRGAVFGEFTPTPGIGIGFTKNANHLFASYWDRHCYGMI
ncbi:ATP-grasp fold amidoligase family protein [Mucilaginibacter agri]|uniref:TupA-like ATPgrasp n=1 Tax=Mucilaginibacter agri TaxID=2695265 RepID=A0A966DTI4_9SPHI|nr:ATP-grasp fold amidoligase family protein [Mucilaginibacter agri]NCD69367.1 hypothetical protein [Mucilaginibacter agri]